MGESITYADFGLFYTLYELAEDDNVPDFAVQFDLPALGEVRVRKATPLCLLASLVAPF